jgi:hypothetical protein
MPVLTLPKVGHGNDRPLGEQPIEALVMSRPGRVLAGRVATKSSQGVNELVPLCLHPSLTGTASDRQRGTPVGRSVP